MDKNFHHQEGTHKDEPNWKLIALQINEEFHFAELEVGKEVRSQLNCSCKIKAEPGKKRLVRKWKEAELNRLKQLASDPSNRNSGLVQSKAKGTLNWERILEILNAEFSPDEKTGQLFTFASCNNQLQRNGAEKTNT